MASQSSRPAATVPSVPQRARRIPDEEWEIWREKLVKLFLEDDVPRKAIVTIMAEKHDFMITEVQLKNRFKKWDVKKYIPDDDLRIMLALKRKRQSVGKDARFQYKGHDVEQERMERAWKRQRGPLLSPEFIPPYIRLHASREHSPQDALYGSSLNSADHHTVPLQNLNIPLLELYHERGSPSAAFHNPIEFESEFTFDTSQAVRESDSCSATHADQSSGDLVMGEAPATAPLQSDVTDFWGDVIPSTEMQVQHSGISTVLQDYGLHELFSATQFSRASSTHVSSIDWQRYINFSPSMRMSSGAPALASRSPRSPSRPLSTIRGRSDNVIRASRERQSSQSMTSQQSDGPITFSTFNGIDPERVMLPLQLLGSIYIEFLEFTREDWDIWTILHSWGSTLDHLYSTLSSSWLSLEMEDLICRSYELSAQAIRRRQAARPVSSDAMCLLSTPEDDRECEGPKTARQPIEHGNSETDLRLQLTSRIQRSTSMGRLNVEFSTPPQDSPYVDTSDVPCVVNISFIPKRQQRTIGISAIFRKYLSASQPCSIPPRLRTFNVIPYDSQLIGCILENDILGVQRLFTEGKASPLDVDSHGFSLLSYAMTHKSSDLFRLLLEGGAGTQNCNSYFNTIDIIWAIWSYFTDYSGDEGQAPDLADFDAGMNLTRLALKHGCDIEEAVPYNDFYFNALSDVNSRSWSQVYPSSPIEILDFLLNIGYDLEQRSSDGLTALLHASCQHMPHIIKCLRLFIKRGADLHTTDFEGKGALHCALAAPDIYDEWYGTLNDVWWSDSENVIDNANWTARFRFNTEDDRHEEDYEDEGIDPGPLLDDIINNSYHYADGAANEYDIDYIFCEDDDGVRHMIHDPMQVLKKRTRFKLLTLLQLGCDPNVVDHEGLSPSDYAMERGLLPQWRWALLNAGYVHHEQNGWVKSSLLD